MIPKIIHQTWKTQSMTPDMLSWTNSWKAFHNDWKYFFWSDEDLLQLCKNHFPQLLNLYCAYPFNVQRADIARYMILYLHGGIYADIDTECLKSFSDLIDTHELIIPKWYNAVSNYILGATTKSSFFSFVLTEVSTPVISYTGYNKNKYVLSSTGPGFLYDCIKKYNKQVQLFDSKGYINHYNMYSWL